MCAFILSDVFTADSQEVLHPIPRTAPPCRHNLLAMCLVVRLFRASMFFFKFLYLCLRLLYGQDVESISVGITYFFQSSSSDVQNLPDGSLFKKLKSSPFLFVVTIWSMFSAFSFRGLGRLSYNARYTNIMYAASSFCSPSLHFKV